MFHASARLRVLLTLRAAKSPPLSIPSHIDHSRARATALGRVWLAALAALDARAAPPPADVEFFETKIRPVLAQDCYECHRTGGKRKAGLALDHRQGLLDGGDSGRVIVPGDPAASLLIQAIRHESEDLMMPKSGAKLEPAVIADFERWVRMGAPDPRDAPPTEAQVAADTDWDAVMLRRKNWWSFQPIRKPDTSQPAAPGASGHAVDQLLGAKLAAANRPRAPRADRPTLIRRLSYALRGLPPTTAEIAAFALDPREDAGARQVDAFLASPRFGERWARHWMDWTRYADSHGSEGDAPIPNAWRYRDYLIRALNSDVPYDQMVREHLAGDLLENPRLNRELGLNESALGIGHLRMVLHGFAPTDALEEKLRFTDDQINVVSKAFLGLTVSCARCHNHKFDPISQQDFYSWYGIFTSAAPAAIAVDAPDPAERDRRAELMRLKDRIRDALANAWQQDADAIAGKLSAPAADLKKAIEAAKDPAAVLHPFFVLRSDTAKAGEATGALDGWRSNAPGAARQPAPAYPKHWDLTRVSDFAAWRHDGRGAAEINGAGAFVVAPEGGRVLTGIYPAGVHSHLISSKDRGVLLSPKFMLDDKYDLWLRIAGEGGAFARFVVQNFPREGSVYPVQKLVGLQRRWMKLPLDYWQGDQIHVELTTAADQPVLADVNATRSWFGISEVVFTKTGEPGPVEAGEIAEPILAALGDRDPTTAAELADGYATAVRNCVQAWRGGQTTDGQALFLDQLLRVGLLRNTLGELGDVQPLLAAYREIESAIRVPTRAPGVIETGAVDQPLFVRGNHKQPGDLVSRHFLDAIDATPYRGKGSGRLALAGDLFRADNPLTARVIVNRVWHHLFGRGLVATTDNFGRMGQLPSHPELLDFLAAWFVEHGYSMKALIRFLVTSETWQSSSEPPPGALEKDPDNVLLSHAPIRRLEAEAIRDALLSVSGDLKRDEMYGPPVTGRAPRRSVYLRVKRNDLDPFLAAFDAPVPAGTIGRRDITNVPGQSLTLLNDPFVRELAEHWARRLETQPELHDPGARVQAMFTSALGRPATAEETEKSQRFVEWATAQGVATKAEKSAAEAAVAATQARLTALTDMVIARVLAKRGAPGVVPAPAPPEPLASWDFADGLQDRSGALHGKILGDAKIADGALVLDGKSGHVATANLTKTLRAKTLEAWVQLDNLTQRGGGVMTVQSGNGATFDAIVFAEREAAQWLAGSNNGTRSESFKGPAENDVGPAYVHVAITYADDGTVTGYRNGVTYGISYVKSPLVAFAAGKAQVLFGNRHGAPGGNKMLAGKIRSARLYDRALTAAEIAASAGSDASFVAKSEQIAALNEGERAERERLESELADATKRLKAMQKTEGLASAWADLGHAIFNLKEFIFVR
ncbi:MAG: DUF1553 domain-containing protein [Opitutus sp.]|nr:DUF1553 domain-containing protein [Opitutus sp.]